MTDEAAHVAGRQKRNEIRGQSRSGRGPARTAGATQAAMAAGPSAERSESPSVAGSTRDRRHETAVAAGQSTSCPRSDRRSRSFLQSDTGFPGTLGRTSLNRKRSLIATTSPLSPGTPGERGRGCGKRRRATRDSHACRRHAVTARHSVPPKPELSPGVTGERGKTKLRRTLPRFNTEPFPMHIADRLRPEHQECRWRR